MRIEILPFFVLIATATVIYRTSELATGQRRHFCNTEYEIEQQIGAGANGQVFRAKALVAIKQIKFQSGFARIADAEINIFNLLRGDPYVLQMICSSKENGIAFIVTEYCAGGDLASHLESHGIFNEPVIRNWLAQLATGLMYLKHKNVLHGDLKAQNILVCYPVSREENPVLKIADFGNSRILPPGKGVRGRIIGTPVIVAPEVFRNQPYDQRVDLWALGIVIFEATFGRHPFEPFYDPSGDWNKAVSSAIEFQFQRNFNRVMIPAHPSISHDLASLIQRILTPVEQRIDLHTVHTIANRFVWKTLQE